jgi:phosphoglycerate dehydrogenase-like enzyme
MTDSSRPTSAGKPRILLVTSTGFTEAQVQKLAGDHPAGEITGSPDDRDSLRKAVQGASALIGCPRHLFDDGLLDLAGPSFRWIHASGAGCEDFLTPGVIESDIVLTNGKIIQGPECADQAMLLLLSLVRRLKSVLLGEPFERPIELRGKTACVVGLGGIGLLIAERCAAFGMTVRGVNDDYVPMLSFLTDVLAPDRLNEAMNDADVVINATPLTSLTRAMYGSEEFSAMKKGAYFVNVSRGKIVDTDALVGSLTSGHLGGAGLDVTDPEPLPEDHPLRALPNVVITPHLAGLSDRNRDRSYELIDANVRLFLAGRPLHNVVDKRRGH